MSGSSSVQTFSSHPIQQLYNSNTHTQMPQPSSILSLNFSTQSIKIIKRIATEQIQLAKNTNKEVTNSHPKNKSLFNGRKFHTLALPDSDLYFLVKKPSTTEMGTFKDFQPAELFRWDHEQKKINKLPNIARIRFNSATLEVQDTSGREIDTLKKLDHPNIVKLLCSMSYKNKKVIYEELYPTDLYLFLLSDKFKSLTMGEKKIFSLSTAKQILMALSYIHSQDIIYNDLKSNNILVNYDGGIKIALTDFGLSLYSSEINTSRVTGCYQFIASERCFKFGLVNNQPLHATDNLEIQSSIDHSVDIWAFGISLLNLDFENPLLYPFFSNYIHLLLSLHSNVAPIIDLKIIEKAKEDQLEDEKGSKIEVFSLLQDLGNTITDGLQRLQILSESLLISSPTNPNKATLSEATLFESFKLLSFQQDLYIQQVKQILTTYPLIDSDELNNFQTFIKSSYLQLQKINSHILRSYFLNMHNAPTPSKDDGLIPFLIQMALQPDKRKRITIPQALAAIDSENISKKRSREKLDQNTIEL